MTRTLNPSDVTHTPESQFNARCRVIYRMQTAGPEHFDMNHWYAKFIDEIPMDIPPLHMPKALDLTICGTTACAAGWGMLDFVEHFEGDRIREIYAYELEGHVAEYLGVSPRLFHVYRWQDMESEIMLDGFNEVYDIPADVEPEDAAEFHKRNKRIEWDTVIRYLKSLNDEYLASLDHDPSCCPVCGGTDDSPFHKNVCLKDLGTYPNPEATYPGRV